MENTRSKIEEEYKNLQTIKETTIRTKRTLEDSLQNMTVDEAKSLYDLTKRNIDLQEQFIQKLNTYLDISKFNSPV